MSWQMAEELAAEYLRQMGYRDVRRVPDGPDGGIDVRGSGICGQVKFWSSPVGIGEVQRLRGAAGPAVAAFFSYSGYTKSAVEWADTNEVALFSFDEQANVKPENSRASQLRLPRGFEDMADFDAFLAEWHAFDLLWRRTRRGVESRLRASVSYYQEHQGEYTPERSERLNTLVDYSAEFSRYLASWFEHHVEGGSIPSRSELARKRSELSDYLSWISEFWNEPVEAILAPSQAFVFTEEGWRAIQP